MPDVVELTKALIAAESVTPARGSVFDVLEAALLPLGFTVERLHEINPGLIVLSISGFGHDGPQGGRAGYDQIAQGEAGLMSLTGPSPDQPTRVGVPIGDLLAGMYGAYGVVAALHERNRTGKGRVPCRPTDRPVNPTQQRHRAQDRRRRQERGHRQDVAGYCIRPGNGDRQPDRGSANPQPLSSPRPYHSSITHNRQTHECHETHDRLKCSRPRQQVPAEHTDPVR